MKTIESLMREVGEIREEYWDHKIAPKKVSARLEFLFQMIAYLKTAPSENLLLDQKAEIQRLLEVLRKRYPEWLRCMAPNDVAPEKRKALYEKENEIPKLRKQLKTLDFLLN